MDKVMLQQALETVDLDLCRIVEALLEPESQPGATIDQVRATQQRVQQALRQSAMTIDVGEVAWESLVEAASQSNWIPPEYYVNDWVSDCAQFLRVSGPAEALSAARWDALMRCPRIRMFGSAGVNTETGERTNGEKEWVHFGAEFWSRYDMDRFPDLKEAGEQSTQWGRHALTAIADDILAQDTRKHRRCVNCKTVVTHATKPEACLWFGRTFAEVNQFGARQP